MILFTDFSRDNVEGGMTLRPVVLNGTLTVSLSVSLLKVYLFTNYVVKLKCLNCYTTGLDLTRCLSRYENLSNLTVVISRLCFPDDTCNELEIHLRLI